MIRIFHSTIHNQFTITLFHDDSLVTYEIELFHINIRSQWSCFGCYIFIFTQEFDLLFYNLNSARIFFREERTGDGFGSTSSLAL